MYKPRHLPDVLAMCADVGKAERLLNWSPQFALEKRVAHVINFGIAFRTLRKVKLLRIWLGIALLAALVVLRGNVIASAWFGNLGSLALLREWKAISETPYLLRCEQILESPAAASSIAKALSLDPLNQRAWLNTGRVAWLQGKCSDALAAWHQAVTLSPRDSIAKLELANAFYAYGNVSQAIAYYQELDAAPYLYSKGRKAQGVDGIGAVALYELGLEVAPLPEMMKELANCYRSLGRYEKAADTMQQLLSTVDENDPDYWWALGYLAELKDTPTQAINAYQQGSQLAEDRYPFYWQIANICKVEKDFSCARSYFERARADKPLRIRPYIALGDLERAQERYDAALGWYRQANDVYPKSELPEYYQGFVFWEQGKFGQAQALFLEANMQNPENANVVYFLAKSTYEVGDLSQAIMYLEQAVALNVNESKSWPWIRELGNWYEESERCRDAISAYEKVLTIYPNEKETQNRLERAREICP